MCVGTQRGGGATKPVGPGPGPVRGAEGEAVAAIICLLVGSTCKDSRALTVRAGDEGSPAPRKGGEVSSDAGKAAPVQRLEPPGRGPCTPACSSVVLPSPRLARSPGCPRCGP